MFESFKRQNDSVFNMPIDVQYVFYSDLPSDERVSEFTRKVVSFFDASEKMGLPGIPVAYDIRSHNGGFYEPPFLYTSSCEEQNIKVKYRWNRFGYICTSADGENMLKRMFSENLDSAFPFHPANSVALYTKVDNNAFADGILAPKLEQLGVQRALIYGMNTTRCVAETIIGGLEKSTLCFDVVYDLLADTHLGEDSPEQEADSLFHKRALEEILEKNGYGSSPRVRFVTAQQVLDELREDRLVAPAEVLATRPLSAHAAVKNAAKSVYQTATL